MDPCTKPVAEQTASEIASCAGNVVKDAAVDVVSHPGTASITNWSLAILCLLVLLLLFGALFRRG
jgi:hypothetical protein